MITLGLRKMLERFGVPHKHLKRRADVLKELLKCEKKSKGWTIPLKKTRYRMDPESEGAIPIVNGIFTPTNRIQLRLALRAYQIEQPNRTTSYPEDERYPGGDVGSHR